MKNFLLNSLTVLVSLLIAGAIGELIVRTFEPKPIQKFVPDPVLGYRATEGDGWDANGFFNTSIPEKTTVLAIGDSMTQGYGVAYDETWPTVFGRLASTSIYQLGLSSSGPLHYQYRFEKYGIPLKPKLVIVAFYFGNDLYDASYLAYHYDYWKSVRDPNFIVDEKPSNDGELRLEVLAGAKRGTLSYSIYTTRLWIRNHVHLYALLGNATRSLRERLNLAHTDDEKLSQVKDLAQGSPDTAYVYDKYPELTTVLSPSYRFDAIDLSYPNTKEGWRLSQESFRTMAKEAHDIGAEFVLVAIPTKEQVYLKFMHEDEGKIPETFLAYEKKEDELLLAFARFCKAENMHCTTLLPNLVEGLKEKKTMFKPVMDGHPFPLGYAEFAEGIYEYVRDNHLLPKS